MLRVDPTTEGVHGKTGAARLSHFLNTFYELICVGLGGQSRELLKTEVVLVRCWLGAQHPLCLSEFGLCRSVP